jgi:hypothetical protein
MKNAYSISAGRLGHVQVYREDIAVYLKGIIFRMSPVWRRVRIPPP